MHNSKDSMIRTPKGSVLGAQRKHIINGKDKSFVALLKNYFRKYCEKSTIHCVRYLYDPHLHSIDRLIWCLLLIISATLCGYLYFTLSERYVSQKIQTVVENPLYPVFNVQFPAVAICPENRVDWSKLEAAKNKFLPPNSSMELVETFTKLVTYMENLRFGHYEQNITEMEAINLEALDYINLSSLGLFLMLGCQDIFVPYSCRWRQRRFNCCEYFIVEKTEYGFCLVFNSQLSPMAQAIVKREGANFYPRHNARAGQNTALNFELLIDDKFMRPNSSITDNVYIMIKKSDQLTNAMYYMSPNTEIYVTVRPELTITDNATRSVSPEQRNCRFIDEVTDFGVNDVFGRYSTKNLLTNCLNQCHEYYLIKMCNCTVFIFFFTNLKARNCTASDLRCISKYNDIFSNDKRPEEDEYYKSTKPGMTCHCMVACNLLEYYTSMTVLPMPSATKPKSPHQKLFKVDVHYQLEFILKYRTSLEFSSIDLIANLGGIFGLCLGASIVSAVELIYYSTVGLFLLFLRNDYFNSLKIEVQSLWQKLMRWLGFQGADELLSNHSDGDLYHHRYTRNAW